MVVYICALGIPLMPAACCIALKGALSAASCRPPAWTPGPELLTACSYPAVVSQIIALSVGPGAGLNAPNNNCSNVVQCNSCSNVVELNQASRLVAATGGQFFSGVTAGNIVQVGGRPLSPAGSGAIEV